MLAKVFATTIEKDFGLKITLVTMDIVHENGPVPHSFLLAPEGSDQRVPEVHAAIDEYNHFLVTRYADGYLAGELLEPQALIHAIALMFGRELRDALNPEQMDEVLARNAVETDSQICHSHDFCDANMVMLAAFEKLGFTEDDVIPDHSRWPRVMEAMCGLWSAAWDEAKGRGFAIEALSRAVVPCARPTMGM